MKRNWLTLTLMSLCGFSAIANASVTENLNSGVNASIPGQGRSAPPAAVQSSQKSLKVERFVGTGSAVHTIDLGVYPDAQMYDQKKKAAEASAEKNAPLQIGFARDIPENLRTIPLAILPWQNQTNGAKTLKFDVAAPGAAGLRIGYRFDGPADGAELRFVGSANPEVYKARSSPTNELLWSPTLDGERGTVELAVLAGFDPAAFRLVLEQVSHLWIAGDGLKAANSRDPALCPGETQSGIGCARSCNIDTKCVPNPSQALLDAASATTKLTYVSGGRAFLCTGTLLNSNPFSGIPYIYTAAHCIGTQAEASTLETNWFFDAVSCGSRAQPPSQRVTTGSVLLVTDVTMDVTLLRMNDLPPNGAIFAAWDATVIPNNAVVTGLHHAAGDLKMYSQGTMQGYQRGPQLCNGVTCSTFNRDSYINVRWTPGQGTTEQGSSGSGIFTFKNDCGGGVPCYELRGGLEGGAASCSNTAGIDRYSRMDLLYTKLAPYLAPGAIIPSNTSATNIAMEFFNPEYDYYFLTSIPSAKSVLSDLWRDDKGNFVFYPTGYWFKLDSTASLQTAPFQRYYVPGAARNGTRGTHFYTALPGEQGAIRDFGREYFGAACNTMPKGDFCNEGTEGYVFPIINSGLSATCAFGERKIWRVYRNNPADDGNHRYITNEGHYNYVVNQLGWSGENVNLCVRP